MPTIKEILSQKAVDKKSSSAGVQNKPEYCFDNCPFCYKRTGFVNDTSPRKIGIMCKAPLVGDTVKAIPWTSKSGWFRKKVLLEENDINPDDVSIFHLLRCSAKYGFPTGGDLKRAERACRHYDIRLNSFNPNLFIVTLDVDNMAKSPPFVSLVRADLQKAMRFANDGYRPLLLSGKEVMSAYAPWLKGGVKDWRGHFWEGDFELETEEERQSFKAAKWRKRK